MGKKGQPTLEGHSSGQSNKPLSKPAHALPFSAVIEELGCDTEEGLSTTKAKELHQQWGNNDLGEGGGVQPGKILLRQVAYVVHTPNSTSKSLLTILVMP
jgi:Na+-exporting ATPase